jgi:hypothetical protein
MAVNLSISTSTALLAGSALFFISAIAIAAIRNVARRNRRATPAYPSQPHTSTMWVNQPVSAPATKGNLTPDYAVSNDVVHAVAQQASPAAPTITS